MRKTFLGVLVFMSQLIFAQGIEVSCGFGAILETPKPLHSTGKEYFSRR